MAGLGCRLCAKPTEADALVWFRGWELEQHIAKSPRNGHGFALNLEPETFYPMCEPCSGEVAPDAPRYRLKGLRFKRIT